ncbi:MAG: hypothetical protein ACFB2X_24545 [Rivularia sp. (in: cyanobacteria)]
MIITNNFVFVHLHKSGGTFVGKTILKLFPEARQIGYHYPITMIPPEYQNLPVLGVVRNPWDFYVSYYAFQKSLVAKFEAEKGNLSQTEYQSLVDRGIDPRNGIDILFDVLSNEGKLDFFQTTTNFLNLGSPAGKLDEVLELMPAELGRRGKFTPIQKQGFRGMNIIRDDLEKIRDTGKGFYTFLFEHIYGIENNVYFARMETLRQDLINILQQFGIEINQLKQEFIKSAARENVSNHKNYLSYYTAELENLVKEKDALVIDKFDYKLSHENLSYSLENSPV